MTVENEQKTAALLNILVADLHVLGTLARNLHWNVYGPFFGPLHQLYGELYDSTSGWEDRVAERVRQVSVAAVVGSSEEFLRFGRLQERPGRLVKDDKSVKLAYDTVEGFVTLLREDVEKEFLDCTTQNELLSLVADMEKFCWKLRATLGEK